MAKRAQYGENKLEEVKKSELLKFLGYFWGPMPAMIWLATIVVALEGDWDDFAVLFVLQVVNGTVGYFEEKSAGDAIEALKQSLAPKAKVIRQDSSGTTTSMSIDAKELVPGDVVEVKLGDIIPADCILGPGKEIQVDQSAINGESLPAVRREGELVYLGSIMVSGEIEAWVAFTGDRTEVGKSAKLVNKAAQEQQGRFQRIMLENSRALLILSLILCTAIFFKLYSENIGFLEALSTVVVILVACIPIAMQIVSTTVFAVGGRTLAEKKAILARLSAIEELAGMDILCSDKTGTLTMNKLTLNTPELVSDDVSEEQITFYAALASRRSGAAVDAIDTVIVANVSEEFQAKYEEWEEVDFVPFDPKNKRTEAILNGPGGKVRIVKGAVQVILEMSANKKDVEERVMAANQSLAARGFRSLGVAMTNPNSDDLIFLGVLSLFDPPRADTAETIQHANAKGIAVKMITGDQTAIAIETAKNINIGGDIPKIYDMHALAACDGEQKDSMCRTADGFAEVMPEDKYNIVENLQHQTFTVGMTGDGVNDAPALKKAQIGIAVEGATDAARAAADIVLTEPGLSVIITAIITAREIFARVRNYVIYRIACTLQLVFFFFIGCLVFYPDQYYCTKDSANDVISGSVMPSCEGTEDFEDGSSSYPFYYPSAKYSFCIPVLGIVIITILNDGCMLTIARDHVVPSEEPQAWDLNKLRTVATVLGMIPLLSSLLMLYLGLNCADGLYPWYVPWLISMPGCIQSSRPDFSYAGMLNTSAK